MMQRGMANWATRTIRFAGLVFAASVLAVGTLAACGGGSGGGGTNDGSGTNFSSGTNDGGSSVSSGGTTDGGSSGGAVTGTVTWPDGHAAANASVYFYNYDPGFSASGWSDGEYQVQQLAADGSYSLPGCPCQDLTAYLYVPATPGADPANGGQDCWIIMQDDNQTYSGRQANPGDDINWRALDMACSATWYTSDQPTVQSEYTTVLPSLNSGSWQSAEARTSSGGSGGS
jgi:hypothetical protein